MVNGETGVRFKVSLQSMETMNFEVLQFKTLMLPSCVLKTLAQLCLHFVLLNRLHLVTAELHSSSGEVLYLAFSRSTNQSVAHLRPALQRKALPPALLTSNSPVSTWPAVRSQGHIQTT